MLKLTSKSLIVNDFEEKILKQHIEKLVEQQQEKINEKLKRLQQKNARIEAVEKNFVEWANKKQSQIKQKLEKSSKNKSQYLNKIVKKCKDHEKYLGQKLANYHNKKKDNLRQAWKQASKYKVNNDNENQNLMKSQQKSKEVKKSGFITQFNMLEGSRLTNKHDNYRELEYQSNQKKFRIKQKKLDHSFKNLKINTQVHFLTQCADTIDENDQDKTQLKLQQTFDRFKKNNFESEQAKIQQLGQRLDKIEKSRLRKLEILKKRKQNSGTTFIHQQKQVKRKQSPQRVQSQQIKNKQKRVRDWSQATKYKRLQFFESHLQNGSDYLTSQKIRYMKNKLAKQIASSAIQKKLYMERLTH